MRSDEKIAVGVSHIQINVAFSLQTSLDRILILRKLYKNKEYSTRYAINKLIIKILCFKIFNSLIRFIFYINTIQILKEISSIVIETYFVKLTSTYLSKFTLVMKINIVNNLYNLQ